MKKLDPCLPKCSEIFCHFGCYLVKICNSLKGKKPVSFRRENYLAANSKQVNLIFSNLHQFGTCKLLLDGDNHCPDYDKLDILFTWKLNWNTFVSSFRQTRLVNDVLLRESRREPCIYLKKVFLLFFFLLKKFKQFWIC